MCSCVVSHDITVCVEGQSCTLASCLCSELPLSVCALVRSDITYANAPPARCDIRVEWELR